jgi:hypothetical protein
LLLGGASLIAVGVAIVGLIDGWAGAPVLALASAPGGVGIGLIDAVHYPSRGRLIALGFGVAFAMACGLVWRQARQRRWDRAVARSLRPLDIAMPPASGVAAAPAPASPPVHHQADDPVGAPQIALRQYLLITWASVADHLTQSSHDPHHRAHWTPGPSSAPRRRRRIVSVAKDDRSWIQHVVVEHYRAGSDPAGRAPVLDRGVHKPVVPVLSTTNGRVLLDAERYDAGSPAFCSALLVASALPSSSVGGGCGGCDASPVVPSGLRHAGADPDVRPHWWNLRRPWVTLLPLDAPIGP